MRGSRLKDFLLRKVSVRSVLRLELAEARFGGFVTGFRLKDFELRKVSVGSLWRLGLAEGRFGWFWRAV